MVYYHTYDTSMVLTYVLLYQTKRALYNIENTPPPALAGFITVELVHKPSKCQEYKKKITVVVIGPARDISTAMIPTSK